MTTTAAPRAALYHRVSTVDQDASLVREQLRRAARAREFEVVAELEEIGGGANNDRPGLQEVMGLARDGGIEAVLVWKLDRFGRSALDLLANIRTLNDLGVRFIASSQGIDIKPDGDPISKLMVVMLAAVAEFERDLIVERTRAGLQKAKSRGVRLGRRPKLSGLDRARVRQLRDEGQTWATVARSLGCSVSTAKRALR